MSVTNSYAGALRLLLNQCDTDATFQSDCCIVPPPLAGGYGPEGSPTVCSADLYYQTLRYDGLDIDRIEIGSTCVLVRNDYRYDGLHRVRAMDNVLFTPERVPDAYSTTYRYDKAGNIQELTRRGHIGNTGGTPLYGLIDDLAYTYSPQSPGGIPSSVLHSVADGVQDPVAQPLGVSLLTSGYGYDLNGNATSAGPVTATYNIQNLPTRLTGPGGTKDIAYVYGGGKYRTVQELQPDPTIAPVTETRDYLGGLEFVNGLPETYNFGDGRVVWLPEPHPVTGNPVPTPRVQFRLHDHLGNTVVFFWDKDNDGCVATEAAGADSEILQRLLYYPFGMPMEGLSDWDTEPGQAYRYNGKERDTISGWYDYGFRWYDAGIGRFTGVDPIADKFAWVSVYNYAENSPIANIDLHGLQAYSVVDNNGGERLNGNYGDKNTGTQVKSAIDAIADSDGVSINQVTFKDVGPKEFSTTDGWGGKRSIFHEMEYAYCGSDECGNSVEGAGNIMVPVTSIQTGASLGDVVLGGMMSYGFRALAKGFFIKSAAAKTSTDFVSNVTATSFGKVWGQGTVNVGKTIDAIRNGSLKPAGVYNNIEKHAQLLGKPNGYWQKYELLDYGSKAPLRIIKGGSGELFLTPDHYKSLIPLGGL